MRIKKQGLLILGFFIFNMHSLNVAAEEKIPELSPEAWLEDDSELRALAVNEGELTFIEPIIDKKILSSHTELTLNTDSLTTGWLDMSQCYKYIDPVGETDIVYSYPQIKGLKIQSTHNVTTAEIRGQVVNLQDISKYGSLCVTAKVKVLEKIKPGLYQLKNGPYFRKFLHGYYPYHVSLKINYPANPVSNYKISPTPQKNFKVEQDNQSLFIDAWFEGELTIIIHLSIL